ncbi:Riboflavin biosynthesis protein RibBA [BD1-7 clade bacterium]|uniref:3,4-dihydroxy-2-butanone 4-phosphate synthase n=1 Tax=BD1-7 clade bacterium TaxID=2029982 RepID=A0A5S9MY82_9GAMM|nr:Riboflavin biosynthesis protein RibBA [BD1-7 clade bacterium]CAA0082694.1 Riboflavin biosynthesis protein RibBA [BD1-7 clade bacterium]
MALNTPEELINDIRLGKMVILMDDEDRENEGDLVMAAECVRPQDINFMITHARGLVCMPMSAERCEQLNLPLMVTDPGCQHGTNFTLSIEASEGVSTGISAADRAHTIRTAVALNAKPDDIVQPGHVFPLRAQKGGVLTRAGHTEAGCDLARLAGFEQAAVIVEIMNDDGTMARRPELEAFAQQHDIKIGTIADLIHYRVTNEKTIELIDEGTIQTEYGPFVLQRYRDTLFEDVHFVLKRGDISAETATLARVHVANTIRDVMLADVPESQGWNMQRALRAVAKADAGVIVLLAQQEGAEDLVYSSDLVMGRQSLPEVKEDRHTETNLSVGLGSQLLRAAGVGKMRLMSSPMKYNAISGFDLEVVEFVTYEQEN